MTPLERIQEFELQEAGHKVHAARGARQAEFSSLAQPSKIHRWILPCQPGAQFHDNYDGGTSQGHH
jgi:hypothetical protein